jgi:hypothetical protein
METKINPYLEERLNKEVEVTITLKGTLTGYFDDSIIIDIDNGPKNYMVMTKEAGFGVIITDDNLPSRNDMLVMLEAKKLARRNDDRCDEMAIGYQTARDAEINLLAYLLGVDSE